jgi:Tfp pilus assembly protein PilO
MMQVEELSSRIQKNILNIVVLVVFAIIAYKIFNAQKQQVESIKNETQIELQKGVVLTQISQSEKRFKNLRRLINIKEETSVIDKLNTIAKQSQVKIIVIKPIPAQKVSGYSRHPFALSVAVDNYHTLGKFISALENDPFLFSVDNISVNPDPASESRRFKLQVNLEVSTILIKD